MILLSLLIPVTRDREKQFKRLYYELMQQIAEYYLHNGSSYLIEIIVDSSKKFLEGGLSIGMKRNGLVQKANGKYLCFIDSDDEVAPNYIQKIMEMCDEDKDCCTFKTLIKNDFYWALINMSLENKENEEVSPDNLTQRTVWHICPMRSELAKQHQFENKNHNEDWEWVKMVLPSLQTEVHTEQILTQYNHSEKGSEADKIIQAGYE